jgi:hypothetical protein
LKTGRKENVRTRGPPPLSRLPLRVCLEPPTHNHTWRYGSPLFSCAFFGSPLCKERRRGCGGIRGVCMHEEEATLVGRTTTTTTTAIVVPPSQPPPRECPPSARLGIPLQPLPPVVPFFSGRRVLTAKQHRRHATVLKPPCRRKKKLENPIKRLNKQNRAIHPPRGAVAVAWTWLRTTVVPRFP